MLATLSLPLHLVHRSCPLTPRRTVGVSDAVRRRSAGFSTAESESSDRLWYGDRGTSPNRTSPLLLAQIDLLHLQRAEEALLLDEVADLAMQSIVGIAPSETQG